MSLRIGIVGTGAFAQSFIPPFKAHPLVGQVVLCDLDREKLANNAAKHQIAAPAPRSTRYILPGLIAHESALQGGALLPIPDFGDPPQ